MFPAERDGEWEPLKIREKRILVRNKDGINHSGDTVEAVANPADVVQHDQGAMDLDEEVVYEEDSVSDEGAVYPIQNGRIQNWSCFFALLTHIYNTLSPPFHTPILVVAQPAWTLQDQETLVQFVFEKFKAPAFCLLDAALSICYAYATSTATIVDVGYNKCDITAVREFLINDLGRGIALPHCGGEAMTSRLLELLKTKEPSKEMAEQLKRSAICEILPVGTPMPEEGQIVDVVPNPATVASNGATGPGESQKDSTAAQGGAPRGPGTGAESGDAEPDRPAQGGEDEEGVLDVATIVASGKTNEFLAQKEREKANKAAAKKSALADAAAAAKQKQLPNSKRVKASFYYHERKALEDLASSNAPPVNGSADQHSGNNAGAEILEGEADGDTAAAAARREDRREERRRSREGTAYIRKEIEVGTERFEAASGGVLDQIADAIHRCILAVPEISKRSELWDSLVIVGNGSKVRGEKCPCSPNPELSSVCSRVQGISTCDIERTILDISLQCNYLYFGTAIEFYNPCGNGRKYTSATSPSSANSSPRSRRQSSSACCHYCFQH